MRPSPSPEHSAAPRLHETQTRFLRALRDGSDVLQARPDGGFLEPPCDTLDARWRIYRDGYLIRLAEAIRDDYPAVERMVGPEAFKEICRRHLTATPPSSHDIGRAADGLVQHLASDPVAAKLPFLADLARLERALARAVVTPEAAPLGWGDIAALGPEQVADMPLRAAPATDLVRSPWPLHDLWMARDRPDGEIDIPLDGRPVTILVWRDGLTPRWKTLDEDEASLVAGALAGATPSLLLDSGVFGAGTDAPSRLVAALRRIVELGCLAPPEPYGDTPRAPGEKERR